MKLARQQGGTIRKRDVEGLPHIPEEQAYRELAKLVEGGSLELVGQGAGSRCRIPWATSRNQDKIKMYIILIKTCPDFVLLII